MKLFTQYAVVDKEGTWNEPISLQVLRSVAYGWLAWSLMNGYAWQACLDLLQTTIELWHGLLSLSGRL